MPTAWFGGTVWHRSTFIAPRPTAILTDRTGAFMAQLGGGPAGFGYWPVTQVPDRVAESILALEDRRFWSHPGVDPLAVARALRTDLAAGRRVSGASTLAMQVARMQHPEARTLGAKILEAATALTMTARYGRGAVLKQYLLLAPFGQDSHGIGHAARWYFDRPVADLSWAQIAFLAAIPQSPGLYDPDRPDGLRLVKRRAALALSRLRARAIIDGPDYREALADLRLLTPRLYPSRRPDALHAILQIEALAAGAPPAEQIHSTIDLALQDQVTQITVRRLDSLRQEGARQAAVIIAARAGMTVLTLVGSAAYGDADNGEIDYALRWRSPGSTLKPFIFAQALDRGAIRPDSVLLDAVDSGTGVANADRRFLGPLLVPQALANSRNVPAAALVRADGLDTSQLFLATLGLTDDTDPASRYGLSMAIGGMPTELARLVVAYGALANDGALQPLRWTAEQSVPPPIEAISPATARTITLFLADPMARLPSFARMGTTEFPFPVAVKTGTSQGYRDGWVLEYTDRYVIGVWVGRPDGAPMDDLGGAASAALIGQDILKMLYPVQADGEDDGSFPAPAGSRPVEICAATGRPADGDCAQQMVEYLQPGAPGPARSEDTLASLRVTSPPDHSIYILNPDAPPGLAVLPLRAGGAPNGAPDGGRGGAPLEWFVDGQPYEMARTGETLFWQARPGRHLFQVTAPAAAMASPVVEVTVR